MYVSITPDENLLEAAVLNMCSVDKNLNDESTHFEELENYEHFRLKMEQPDWFKIY